jgi:hypothetical protein
MDVVPLMGVTLNTRFHTHLYPMSERVQERQVAPKLTLGTDLVKLIAEIDEFKGRWEAYKTLSPDRLRALRKVATIESVGSSTRIEGSKLTDAQIETLLSNIAIKSFKSRDEQEVGGYAEAMDLDADGQQIGIVFETATPFDTPREMEDLIAWTRKAIDEGSARIDYKCKPQYAQASIA